ncbi:MAG: hypothetical protein R3253_03490 [Longimicrobiales bacterium]|nr:hypothetical protein [Longimicrobiales bacterium]
MAYLFAAMLAPVLGPVLYRLLHPHPRAVGLVDGFVYIAVPVLVAWQVLPHAWQEQSVVPLVAVVVGFLLPALVEQASHALAEQTDNLAMVVGISGLALHAGLEGAAFAPGAGADTAFALAVILHRIPVGLVVWWLVRPRFGQGAAALGVASLVFATAAGWGLGSEILTEAHASGAELFQIFVSGSLVHVVYHQGRHDHDHSGGHIGSDGHRHPTDHGK